MLISHPEKALFPEVLLMGASSSLQMKEVPISWSAIVIVPVPLSGPCGCQFPFPPLPHLSHNIDSAPGSDILEPLLLQMFPDLALSTCIDAVLLTAWSTGWESAQSPGPVEVVVERVVKLILSR